MLLTEAVVKVHVADGLSDQTYDQVIDQHADDISAALDMALDAVKAKLIETYGQSGIPGFRVTVDVD